MLPNLVDRRSAKRYKVLASLHDGTPLVAAVVRLLANKEGNGMLKTVCLTAILLVMVATAATPSFAQLAGDVPPPPEYQVTDDGTLIIGGDVLADCSQVGIPDPTLREAAPAVQAEEEEVRNEAVQACRASGFATAADTPTSTSASTSAHGSPALNADGLLPKTGGLVLPIVLGSATLVAVGVFSALHTRR